MLADLIKTVDYASGQSANWLLTAGVIILGSVTVIFMRRILREALDLKKELKELYDKHIDVLEGNAAALAEHLYQVKDFGNRAVTAIQDSADVIKSISHSIDGQAEATRQATEAMVLLRHLQSRTAEDVKRAGDESSDAIRRNTQALDERGKRGPRTS